MSSHQDYVARVRYNNVLPVPPNPPKMLHIPGTGMADGKFTSSIYASRLVRDQPLNVEADAELGMPIDLVGLPGVFEGDETCLQALPRPPSPHPHDRPLLKPHSSLGKSISASSGVSFLRKSEYGSADQSRTRVEPATTGVAAGTSRKRRKLDSQPQDDPSSLTQQLSRSFELASSSRGTRASVNGVTPEQDAWNHPKHPTKPNVELLDSYPVLPDFDATPETGGYIVTKFMSNPVSASNVYDDRLDTAILRPLPLNPGYLEHLESQRAAHLADPSRPDPGPPQFDYEFFLPRDADTSNSMKSRINLSPNRFQESLNGDETNGSTEMEAMPFDRVRTYETHQQVGLSEIPFAHTVVLALHDSDGSGKPRFRKGAYVYPVIQRTLIRPRRMTGAGRLGVNTDAGNDEEKVDQLEVSVRPPNESELAGRNVIKARYESTTAAEVVA